jgi:hypothetical protein
VVKRTALKMWRYAMVTLWAPRVSEKVQDVRAVA